MITGHVWVVVEVRGERTVKLHGGFSTQEGAETMAAGVRLAGGYTVLVIRTPTHAPPCRDGGHPDPGGLY